MLLKVYKIRKAGKGPTMQVTLPPLWVQSLELKNGDFLAVEMQDDRLVIRPMFRKDLAQ